MAMDGEALAPQMPHIEPPEGSGWQLHSPYGAQRFKDGPDGRLVRLADVVRWLMRVRETSFANAVRAVCAPLEGDTPPLLYRLDRVDDAAPEDGDHEWFKYFPDCEDLQSLPTQLANARVAARDMKAWWLMPPHELSRLANDPSYPAEYDETKESPFEYSERTDRAGGPKNLAVPFAVAHTLWGWGSVGAGAAAAPTSAPVPGAAVDDPLGALDAELRAAFEAVCKRRALSKHVKNGAREPWPVDDVETVRKVRETLGRSGAKTIAPMLGMTQDAVRDLLERKAKAKAKAAATTANNPFGQVRPKAA